MKLKVTVRMLHHLFVCHGETVYLHINTGGGQKKHAIIVQYLLWRVIMTGQHKQITLSFVIPGYIKFSLVLGPQEVQEDENQRSIVFGRDHE